MSELIDKNFKSVLSEMEMLPLEGESSNLYFVVDKETTTEPHIRIALERAKDYKADAVFFRTFPNGDKRAPIPQIYIYRDITFCPIKHSTYAALHKRLWNAGIVPLAFIFTSDQIKVLNCRQEPDIDKETRAPIFTNFGVLEQLVTIDRTFITREISAGTLWDNPSFKKDFTLESTAYYKLLNHLKLFREELLQEKILSESTVNRILVMAILIQYLNDRKDSAGNGIFKPGFFRQFSTAPAEDVDLASLFRQQGSCIALFRYLSEHFNGGIFELTEEEVHELAEANLSRIADFLQGDLDPNGQGLFWPLYSFKDLPVELISNIYEEFLAKKDKGVVYTPPMLVDLLLDQCLPLAADTLSWKILDPACGSGIFLVGAFKRLIQCWRIANKWKQPTCNDLQGILKNNIFGFDKSSEAILVSAFSLCVALCDELDPLVIWNKLKFDNLRKRNLLDKDFFEIVESGELNNNFDLIIGNPPFESVLTTDSAKAIEAASISTGRPKLPDAQLALLFLEQSLKLIKENSAVCLIQPAGALLYNGQAMPFRQYLFGKFDVKQVLDFTALEGVLFSKAQVAAAAIVGYNTPPSNDKVLHVTFRRTRAIKEGLLFELDPYDLHWISRNTIDTNKYVWKTNLLGGGRLHRLLGRLFADLPSLGEYLNNKKKTHGWQFGEGYNVGCGSYLNESPNPEALKALTSKELMQLFKLKRPAKLAAWITGKYNLPPGSLTKKGLKAGSLSRCKDIFFQETSSSSRAIFSKPHVLIREVVEDVSIPAVYINEDLVFSKQIIGVHAPEKDIDKLQTLASRLNDSGVYGVLAAVMSSRMLVGRASSLLKNDIMELPYPPDTQTMQLNYWEQALIEDIGEYLINFRRNGENSSILTEPDDAHLDQFGEMYCSILNPVYNEFHPLKPVTVGSFVCYPFCFGDVPQFEFPDHKNLLPFLQELLSRRHSSRIFINRILRIYEQNVIFIIKPKQKRYWLRSIALRDADETFSDLLGQGY